MQINKAPCTICHKIRILGSFNNSQVCMECIVEGRLLQYYCKNHQELYQVCKCKTIKEIEVDD